MSVSFSKLSGRFNACGRQREVALAVAVVSVCLIGAPSVQAGDKPAVAGLNAKVDGLAGVVDSDGLGAASASVAAPLGHRFGVQFDGMLGSRSGDSLKGYGAQVFWRDPDTALLGVTASRNGIESLWANRFGATGEYYTSNLTYTLNGGIQTGDLEHTWTGGGAVRFYANDDFAAEASVSGFSDSRFAGLDLEWRPGWKGVEGMSFVANGSLGNDSYEHALVGVRFYFGVEDKSLKRRHREDDPINPLLSNLSRLWATANEERKRAGTGGGVPGFL